MTIINPGSQEAKVSVRFQQQTASFQRISFNRERLPVSGKESTGLQQVLRCPCRSFSARKSNYSEWIAANLATAHPPNSTTATTASLSPFIIQYQWRTHVRPQIFFQGMGNEKVRRTEILQQGPEAEHQWGSRGEAAEADDIFLK